MTRLRDSNLVIDALSGRRVTDFDLLPQEARWTFTDGLNDSRLQPVRPNGKFTSPTWYQLDSDGVWFARGGHSYDTTGFRYWVGLYGRGDSTPKVVYQGSGGHRWIVDLVTVSRDGKTVASVDRLGEIHVWDAATGNPIRIFPGARNSEIWNVDWADTSRLNFGRESNVGGTFAANNYGPIKESFHLEQRFIEDIKPGPRHFHSPDDIQFEVPSKEILRASIDGRDYEFSHPAFGEPAAYMACHNPVDGIRNLIIAGSKSGKLVALEPSPQGTLRIRRWFHGHHSFVTGLSQSPDEKLLASSSIDGTIRLWSLEQMDRKVGDIDFPVRGNQVLDVPAGSETQRVGIELTDTIRTFGALTFYESRALMIRSPFPAGEQLTLGMTRAAGERYEVDFTLQASATHVEPLLSLLITKDNEWVMWSPRGFYDTSGEGDNYIGWHENKGREASALFHKAGQFREELYRPAIVDRILKLRDPDLAVNTLTAAEQATVAADDYRHEESLNNFTPPTVNVAFPADGFETASDTVNVLADVETSGGARITDVTFTVGSLSSATKPVAVEALSDDVKKAYQCSLKLREGLNTITVVASTLKSKSKPATISVTYNPRQSTRIETEEDQRRVFVLAIGVSEYVDDELQDLSFAAKDARDFANIWKQQPGRIDCEIVTNEQATEANIQDAIAGLLEKKPGPDDLVAILFSGHGLYDAQGNYYLATHDTMTGRRLRSTALAQMDLEQLMNRDLAHCRRLLFIDACHSGSTMSSGISARDPWMDCGAVVYASSHWKEVSFERPEWGNGALVKAFLEAATTPAEGPDPASAVVADNTVTAKELDFYFHRRVAELTRGRQHSATKWPITLADFNVVNRLPAASP
ncbi:MAG: caspase family protein [Planctomycetaceae bacterium]